MKQNYENFITEWFSVETGMVNCLVETKPVFLVEAGPMEPYLCYTR